MTYLTPTIIIPAILAAAILSYGFYLRHAHSNGHSIQLSAVSAQPSARVGEVRWITS
jgi:hypothetical protein